LKKQTFRKIREIKLNSKKMGKLKQQSIISWLKSRYSEKAKKIYTNTDSELARHREIENMFLLFDTNRSGTLEIDEISNMFRSNGIQIKKAHLIEMFNIVDADKSGTLTFSEFKDFMLNDDRQKLFTELMKKERDQQAKEFFDYKNIDEIRSPKYGDSKYLPLSAEAMMKHLRYQATRKALINEINASKDGNQKSVKNFISTDRVTSIFGNNSTMSQVHTPKARSARSDICEKSMGDLTNFMKLFSGYNINESLPSQNLINMIIFKRMNLQEAENVMNNRTTIKTASKYGKKKKNLLVPKISQGVIHTMNNSALMSLKNSRLKSVRHSENSLAQNKLNLSSN
jgi:hypothetical protein